MQITGLGKTSKKVSNDMKDIKNLNLSPFAKTGLSKTSKKVSNDMNDIKSKNVSLGKYWVALKDNQVMGMISMRVPNDIDFDDYREKAIDCLGLLGDVKSGEVIETSEKEKYFLQRLTHANRSKKPRENKKYLIHEYRKIV